jgi:hypothetical protein
LKSGLLAAYRHRHDRERSAHPPDGDRNDKVAEREHEHAEPAESFV